MKEGFRALNDFERGLLLRMLASDFPAHEALLEQVSHCAVREFDSHGCIEFDVSGGPIAAIALTVPVEVRARDSDGVPIHVLLFVSNGKIAELEFNKLDGTPINQMPEPDVWEVVVWAS